MTLTQKETSLLKDLRAQEQLCVEKYTKGASGACDGQLKNLFTQIAQQEQQHVQTIDQISQGTVPQMNTGASNQIPTGFQASACDSQQKQNDAYLCSDALAMEKHVSAEYNTCIFEFADPALRSALNHIQTEEQQHGEQIYQYMSVNGMYR